MNTTKIIITLEKEIFKWIIWKYEWISVQNIWTAEIWEIKNWESWNLLIILTKKSCLNEIMNYLYENYFIEKLVNIWTTNIYNKIDLKTWDIVIPNTFITENQEETAIFLDSTIWWNYDLKKFWLILNWVCLSTEEKLDNSEIEKNINEFWIDLVDLESYDILKISIKNENLENTLILKWVYETDKEKIVENCIIVLDLVI